MTNLPRYDEWKMNDPNELTGEQEMTPHQEWHQNYLITRRERIREALSVLGMPEMVAIKRQAIAVMDAKIERLAREPARQMQEVE